MGKRVTIMIDENIDKKIRLKQAQQIQKTNSNVSYSQVINEAVLKGLK